MKNNKISGFTLVELIVVITILAVLATVAFISFQGYTSSSRDSVRLADLKNVEKQLNIYFTQNNIYPDPATPVSIPTGGTQGELAKTVTNTLGVSEVKDPLTGEYYFYRISQNKRKYQIMGFLENGDSITFSPLNSTFAENDIPYSKGDKLGIVLNSDGKTLPTSIDLSTGTYDVIFSNNSQENLSDVSGEENFVELKAADKGVFDESLVGYWDMETFTSDGKLADLSGNNNHGTIHDADNSGLATPVNGMMQFDGVDDYIEIPDDDTLDLPEDMTLIAKIDIDSQGAFSNGFYLYPFLHKKVYDSNNADFMANYMLRLDHFPNKYSYNIASVFGSIQEDQNSVYYNFEQNKISQLNTIIYTRKGRNNYIYFNNKLSSQKETVGTGMYINDAPVRIGTHQDVNNYTSLLHSSIDEIMIFNRSMSQSEIDDIYAEIQ